jgi:arylsulfatase A-like enzyme
MRTWLRLASLAVALGVAGYAISRAAARDASTLASIDPAVFDDVAKDAQPPAAVIAPAGDAGAGARKPNIVLIVADDLGWGDLGAYGARGLATPHLDRLAAGGVRFTNFYASAPVCSPSRAGLLTGRYPLRTGVSYIIFASDVPFAQRMSLAAAKFGTRLGASDFHDSYVAGLPASEITLAEALRVGGYTTGMVGKWHLGDFSHDRQYLPTRHGFDFFEGMPHSNDEMPMAYWNGEQERSPNLGLDQEQITDDLTRAAIGFIDANRDRPFFLYFAHKNVHIPLFPAERFRGTSAAGAYGDSVAELDASVGEIVTALEQRGLRENTLLVFTSDNGPWFQGSAAGLRGRKGMPLEGGMRVPLIVAGPDALPAGRVVETPAMNIDLFPTLVARAGLTPPRDRVLDGRDLWPAITRADAAAPHDALLFFHDKEIDGVRAADWKYYRHVNRFSWPLPYDKPGTLPGKQTAAYVYTDPKTGRSANLLDAGPMLYDLRNDAAESYNVADRHPDETARLEALAAAWEAEFRANPRGWR